MEKDNPLIDFNWDESTDLSNIFSEDANENSPEDFEDNKGFEDFEDDFGDEEDFEKNDSEEKEEKEEKKSSSKNNSKEKVKDFEKEDSSDNIETSIYTDVFKDLKQYGILKHVDIEEGENLDAKQLSKLYEEEYNTEVSNRINAWASQELDEEAQQFIIFKRNGGNTRDFLNKLKEINNTGFSDGDISDEDYQDEIIRKQLKEDDWDDDEIEERLESLTNNGKKESVAKKYYERFQKLKSKEIEKIVEEQEEAKRKLKQAQTEFKEELQSTLDSNEELLGFKMTKKDKETIFKSLTERTVRDEDNSLVTPFKQKLDGVFKDPKKLIILTKLLNNDFDMSDFKKSVITQETRKFKSHLENRKGLKNSSFGSSTGEINLSKLFS